MTWGRRRFAFSRVLIARWIILTGWRRISTEPIYTILINIHHLNKWTSSKTTTFKMKWIRAWILEKRRTSISINNKNPIQTKCKYSREFFATRTMRTINRRPPSRSLLKKTMSQLTTASISIHLMVSLYHKKMVWQMDLKMTKEIRIASEWGTMRRWKSA